MERNRAEGRPHDLTSIAMTADDVDTMASIITLGTRYPDVTSSTLNFDWHFEKAFEVFPS
jgi:hypothetical protein